MVFTYGYLRYPFDDLQTFKVVASDNVEADEKAREVFTGYFRDRLVVTTEFWRIRPEKTELQKEIFDHNQWLERLFKKIIFYSIIGVIILAIIWCIWQIR